MIRSPSSVMAKLTGSLSEGCCGPMGMVTRGMSLAPRTAGGLPVLPQRLLVVRPVLRERVASAGGQAGHLEAEQVHQLALVEGRARETLGDGVEDGALAGDAHAQAEDRPTRPGQDVQRPELLRLVRADDGDEPVEPEPARALQHL